jgi:hypothetical protein
VKNLKAIVKNLKAETLFLSLGSGQCYLSLSDGALDAQRLVAVRL